METNPAKLWEKCEDCHGIGCIIEDQAIAYCIKCSGLGQIEVPRPEVIETVWGPMYVGGEG